MSVLVGKKAPGFTADAVIKSQFKKISLEDYRDRYILLFFYPLDFTFVCPTEILAFNEKLPDFEARDTQLLAISTDSHFSHLAWLNTPKKQGGIQGVAYPLISDFNKEISRSYGILLEEQGVALRGLFLIDKSGIVQHQLVNNLDLGRSVEESLRMVDALQYTEKYGEVCPANWSEGKKAMKADQKGLEEYFS